MILYLDTSALVKRYVAEQGTSLVTEAIMSSRVIGTSIISRAELAAALAKAVRMNAVSRDAALSVLQVFRNEWPNLVRVQATELLVARAGAVAWDLGLRGYDAVHLASALSWQEGMDESIFFATFDRRLWEAAAQQGLIAFPPDLPALIAAWPRAPS